MPQEVRNEVSGNVQKNAFVLQTGVLSFHRHEMGRRVWWPDLVALTALCLVVAVIVWSQTPVLVPPTLDLTAQVVQSCTQRYEDPAAPDAITRAYTDTAKVELSAKNPSDEEVLLVGMRVDVLHRAGPPTSGRYRRVWCRWITPLTTRYVVFDLDEPEPLVTGGRFAPRARVGPNLPPPRSAGFPYQISRLDPEYFEVSFRAKRCDCTFLIVLDWVVGGGRRQSTTTPFRVVPKVPSLIA